MAQVADHLSVAELQAGYRGSGDATLARHDLTIWLLKQGRTMRRPQQGSRTREGTSRIPLVAGASLSDLINRSWYEPRLTDLERRRKFS